MKMKIGAAVLFALLTANGLAFADADDTKWIVQCIKDNKNEGAKEEVVYKYCQCMNDKMDSNETKSISQWEKTHPQEMKECEKKSGWK
ncbi:MAG TPA: hypothetical protein HPP76_04545 [Desulfuromonadales bacterium]|nr:hypothetical protein [Desulfuromonadales bacterium]